MDSDDAKDSGINNLPVTDKLRIFFGVFTYFICTLGLPPAYWLGQENNIWQGYSYSFWLIFCGFGAGLGMLIFPKKSWNLSGLTRFWLCLWGILTGLSIFWFFQWLAGDSKVIFRSDVILICFTGFFLATIPFTLIDFLTGFKALNSTDSQKHLPAGSGLHAFFIFAGSFFVMSFMLAIRFQKIQINDNLLFWLITNGLVIAALFFLTIGKKNGNEADDSENDSVLEGFRKISSHLASGIGLVVTMVAVAAFYSHSAGRAMAEVIGFFSLILFFLRAKPQKSKCEFKRLLKNQAGVIPAFT